MTVELLLISGSGGAAPPPPPASEPVALGQPAPVPILVRDVRTTQLIAEIHEYEDLTYWRRSPEAGEFELTLRRSSVNADWVTAGRLIEVRRDGVFDFAGVIEKREYDAITERWKLRGPDLLGFFLGRRIAGISAPEAYTDVAAETVAKTYVQNNGGPNSLLPRRFQAELAGITWTVQADGAIGSPVSFSALRRNLLNQVLVPVCKSGDILQHVVMTPGVGYEYRVTAPVDATVEGVGNLPFAVSSANVSALTYREDLAAVRNAVYTVGPGTNDARVVTVVEDSDSIATHLRRETSEDGRDAALEEQQIQLGRVVIDESLAQRVSAEAQPLYVVEQGGGVRGAEYGVDYDLGYDVTLALPEVGVSGIVRRIVEVRVALNQDGEEITVALGTSPRTLPAVLSDALRRAQLAAVS